MRSLARAAPQNKLELDVHAVELCGWVPTVDGPALRRDRDIAGRYAHAVELQELVQTVANGIQQADSQNPVAVSKRSGAAYQPGIGPHTEGETITLALDAVAPNGALPPHAREVPYPAVPRSRCDLVLDGDERWAVEIKMLRLMGDNGKPNDNMLMHILSPYPAHRSALTDCAKLLASGFDRRAAIIIFGYDYQAWPMDPAVEAFERLATRIARLTPTLSASFEDLIHPVHQRGRVFGWEILPL